MDRVVTPLAVLRRVDGRLRIESVHPGATVEEVRANTGFALGEGYAIGQTPPPSAEELGALARVDGGRARDLEFG